MIDTASSSPSPARLVENLVALMRLESLGTDRFRGASEDIGTPNLFGGQVLGQSLMAAGLTCDRPVHSLHAYFLLAGDKREPVDYTVDRVRDGRSFATRRVVAEQHGRTIFTMMASFHASEPDAFVHQRPMPSAPDPTSLGGDAGQRGAFAKRLPPHMRHWVLAQRPVDHRDAISLNPLAPEPGPAEALAWVRAIAPLPDEPLLHRALLAYASDFGLLRAALRPHGLSFMNSGLQVASLDHAMWFHRDFRFDDWLLYSVDSPSAQAARALCRGELYAADGRLIASVAQEAMLRLRA